jgi:hypothetical protein
LALVTEVWHQAQTGDDSLALTHSKGVFPARLTDSILVFPAFGWWRR